MRKINQCHNIQDLRLAAKKRLPKGIFQYIDRGSEDERALAVNRRCFDDIQMIPSAFKDISKINLKTQALGETTELPLAIAPTGIAGLCDYEGELSLARAAETFGIPFSLATGSLTPLEKIASTSKGRLWFQLYMWKEEDLSLELIKKACQAGYEALIITVDIGLGNNREYNKHNGFSMPFKYSARSVMDVCSRPGWVLGVLARYLKNGGMPTNANFPEKYRNRITSSSNLKPTRHDSLTWDVIDRIRKVWPKKIIVKGILNPDDAVEAARRGVDAVIVSNHGGRNMDSSVSPLQMLPVIVDRLRDQNTEVFYDSGIRRGSDIIKALASGADLVMIGRATLYGIAAGGQPGAERALSLLRDEMVKTLGYLGRPNVDELSADVFFQSKCD